MHWAGTKQRIGLKIRIVKIGKLSIEIWSCAIVRKSEINGWRTLGNEQIIKEDQENGGEAKKE